MNSNNISDFYIKGIEVAKLLGYKSPNNWKANIKNKGIEPSGSFISYTQLSEWMVYINDPEKTQPILDKYKKSDTPYIKPTISRPAPRQKKKIVPVSSPPPISSIAARGEKLEEIFRSKVFLYTSFVIVMCIEALLHTSTLLVVYDIKFSIDSYISIATFISMLILLFIVCFSIESIVFICTVHTDRFQGNTAFGIVVLFGAYNACMNVFSLLYKIPVFSWDLAIPSMCQGIALSAAPIGIAYVLKKQ